MKKSFTSLKFDWLNTVMADQLLNPTARNVAYWIAQHINEKTSQAFLSDELLADKVGVTERSIRRARDELKLRGWIIWKRTKTANIYKLNATSMNRVLDTQIMLKEMRSERREKRIQDRTKMSYPDDQDRTFLTGQDRTNLSLRPDTDVRHTPNDNTLVVNTLKKGALPAEQ